MLHIRSSFSQSYFRKILLFLLVMAFFSIALFFSLSKKEQSSPSFQEITKYVFLEDITSDTLSLHYTLAFPSTYGISSYPLTLPYYNDKNEKNSQTQIENILYLLEKIQPDNLSKEERYTYYLFKDYLQKEREGASFVLFQEIFSPSSGIITQYPVLMAEYTFRRKQDVTDYLTLLAQTGTYFSSLLDFQTKRAKEGFALSDSSLTEIINQCDTIITKNELENNSHFLQQTFRERIMTLVTNDILSEKQASYYIEKNNQILSQIVLPAYEMTGDHLLLLKGSCKNEQGLCFYEQGKSYYEWLIQKTVGTNRSAEEMLLLLEQDYEQNLLLLNTLQDKLLQSDISLDTLDTPFPLTDPNVILQSLEQLMASDFPSLFTLSDKKIETRIKSVSPCMEDYVSPAFYLLPPIDDMWNNVIYINQKQTPEGLDLFTTLAHEGYPGHLYQTVYYQLTAQQNQLPDIRHLLNFDGYAEGWAIYTEFYSFDYAASLFSKEKQDTLYLLFQLLSCDRKLQLCMLSQLDIQLHYNGASYDTAKQLLSNYGITEEETCQNVYQYILEEPGNYLKYYMGYLEILSLKEKAKTLMGSAFSDYNFHKFFLDAGPSDFINLEKRLLECV